MMLASHGTAGARRRMRHHCREPRELRFLGCSGGDAVLECHGTDGRTYVLRFDADDLAVVEAASKERKRQDKAANRAVAETV